MSKVYATPATSRMVQRRCADMHTTIAIPI